jgi:hypothetical protein
MKNSKYKRDYIIIITCSLLWLYITSCSKDNNHNNSKPKNTVNVNVFNNFNLSLGPITSFCEDLEGNIWICDINNVYSFRDNNLQRKYTLSDGSSTTLFCPKILKNNKNEIYIVGATGPSSPNTALIIYQIKNGNLIPYFSIDDGGHMPAFIFINKKNEIEMRFGNNSSNLSHSKFNTDTKKYDKFSDIPFKYLEALYDGNSYWHTDPYGSLHKDNVDQNFIAKKIASFGGKIGAISGNGSGGNFMLENNSIWLTFDYNYSNKVPFDFELYNFIGDSKGNIYIFGSNTTNFSGLIFKISPDLAINEIQFPNELISQTLVLKNIFIDSKNAIWIDFVDKSGLSKLAKLTNFL